MSFFSNVYAEDNKLTEKKIKSTLSVPTGAKEPININTWKIIAPDKQVFSLYEQQTDSKIINWLSFSRGHNTQRAFPVVKKEWTTWRTKLTQLMDSLPKSNSCPNPLRFLIMKKDVTSKEKSVCLENITKTEQNEIKNLIASWNSYLYGN